MDNIPVTKPYFPDADVDALTGQIRDILRTGRMIFGPYTQELEQLFSEYTHASHAVAVNTCTTALTIAMKYGGAEKHEVIVPSATFIATPNSVLFAGGKPVFADINSEDLGLDVEDVEKKINKKTRAIIAVHLVGSISKKMDELKKLAQDHNIMLVEDCAHAIGSGGDGTQPGQWSDAACFSFYPTKLITAGLGGMLTTNDEKLAKFAQSIRNHGAGKTRAEIENLGWDAALMEVNCALAIKQMARVKEFVEKRQALAYEYTQQFKSVQGIQLFPFATDKGWNVYRYPVLLGDGVEPEAFMQKMKAEGIGCGRIYIPCHLQPYYQRTFNYPKGMLPVTEDIMARAVCLPVFPQMTIEQVHTVCKAVKGELRE